MSPLNTHSRSDNARKSNTPWRRSNDVIQPKPSPRRKARREMSVLELECRITPEQYEQIHAEHRARVRARFGAKR